MKENKIIGLDEVVYETELDNGLKVYMWVREDVNTFYATYSIKYGSFHTNFKIGNKSYEIPGGIAHYIEHLKFNLGPHETAHEKFYKIGSDTNAFTTFNFTNYQVLGNKEPYKNVDALLDFVQTPYFTKKLVDKERGIIISEAGMGADNPYSLLMYGLLKNIFKREIYSKIITGEVEDIKKITLNDIKLIYDAYYHPANGYLVITGNFNPYEMVARIKENQNKKDFGKYLNPIRINTSEVKNIIKDYEEVEANVTNYKIKVGIKVPLNKKNESDLYKALLYSKIIMKANFGSTSDFKNDLIDKELIYNNFYAVNSFDDYLIYTVTIDTLYKDDVLEKLYHQLDNMELSNSTFKRIVNSNLATIILDYEDVENVNLTIQNELVTYGELKYNKKDILENLKYSDVLDFMKSIDFNNRSTMIVKPFDK